MSKQKFCKEQDLAYHSFLYHLKKDAVSPIAEGFQQVILQSDSITDRIDFYFGDGRRVSFPQSTPAELVRVFVSL